MGHKPERFSHESCKLVHKTFSKHQQTVSKPEHEDSEQVAKCSHNSRNPRISSFMPCRVGKSCHCCLLVWLDVVCRFLVRIHCPGGASFDLILP